MKFIDLEVLCIKNVARDSDGQFNVDTYDDFIDNPQYSDYIQNVDIDINQAFARLVTSEKVLTDSFEVENTEELVKNGNHYELSIPSEADVYKITNVVYINNDNYYLTLLPYTKISRTKILVPRMNTKGKYVVRYCKNLPFFTHDIHKNVELSDYGITDTLINSFVLNFTKAKLWESEEPQLAQSYMNYAETYLQAFDGGDETLYQNSVDITFGY